MSARLVAAFTLALERFDVFRCAILPAFYAARSVLSFNWRLMVSKPVCGPREPDCPVSKLHIQVVSGWIAQITSQNTVKVPGDFCPYPK
jgi:hypothetical protein